MFEHLDDPAPYRPDPALRGAVLAEGRRRQRRRRIAGAAGGSAVVVVALVAGAVLYVGQRVAQVQKVEVAGLPTRQPARGEPSTVLFVGVDTDKGLTAEAPERSGRDVGPDRVVGVRSDTIILARVDPGANSLTVLPIPRDLWVDIAGHGPSKINATLAFGGPSLLIQTIRTNLGIEVDHYVQTDFAGAQDIADRLGGLRLSFPYPVRDLHIGLEAPAGCQTFTDHQALSLARSRHLQEQVDGVWRSDPTSDFGRVERQQTMAAAVLAQVVAVDAGSPGQLVSLLDGVTRDLTVDSNTTVAELVELVRAVVGSDVRQLRLPLVETTQGAADVLDLDPSWTGIVEAFRGGAPGPVAAPPAPAVADGAIVPTLC